MRAIIFPGQGAQVVGMASDFYENFREVRDIFAEANDILGYDLKKIIFAGPFEELSSTVNAQPAIMLASIVMLQVLLKESGKHMEDLCTFVAGHSLGEYTALCAAGSFTRENTLRLLQQRGKAFSAAANRSDTGMVVLRTTKSVVEDIITTIRLTGEILQITNDNTSEQVVVGGNRNALNRLLEIAQQKSIGTKILSVSGAFHSEFMASAVPVMEEILNTCEIKTPIVKVIANYTADVENVLDIRNNLLKQIVYRVRWREIMQQLVKYGVDEFIEIGPGKALTGMVRKDHPTVKAIDLSSWQQMDKFIQTLIG
jgi:[acyl-carrier-protein] S-malonyltransferase